VKSVLCHNAASFIAVNWKTKHHYRQNNPARKKKNGDKGKALMIYGLMIDDLKTKMLFNHQSSILKSSMLFLAGLAACWIIPARLGLGPGG
jgi:hypothetical protein